MAETSAPASGGEHLISHTLDMMSQLDNTPHDLHGRQVGVGTILSAEIYRRVMDLESPEFRVPDLSVDTSFWGKLGKNVEEQYKEKIERLKTAKSVLQKANTWDTLRTEPETPASLTSSNSILPRTSRRGLESGTHSLRSSPPAHCFSTCS